MIAAPLIFLADAVLGSVVGKVTTGVTLALLPPILWRRKDALLEEQRTGINPDHETMVLIQKAKTLGTKLNYSDARAMSEGAEDLRLVSVPSDALPEALKMFGGDYVLMPSERVELAAWLLVGQAFYDRGPCAGYRVSDLMLGGNEDYAYLRAKVLVLKNHYTPTRLKDPRIRALVASQREQLAA
jgi:hypothetical protein